jgi:hypothetical protein
MDDKTTFKGLHMNKWQGKWKKNMLDDKVYHNQQCEE